MAGPPIGPFAVHAAACGLEKAIADAIHAEIANVAKAELDRAIEEAVERTKRKASDIVARISVATASQMTFERFGQQLTIRVLMPDNEKKS